MDDERQPAASGDRDLRLEGAHLVAPRGTFAVVVEAALADRADERVGGELTQVGGGRVVEAFGRVRMTADGGKDLSWPAPAAIASRLTALVHADREDPLDAGGERLGDELGVRRLTGAEVGVAVDHEPV